MKRMFFRIRRMFYRRLAMLISNNRNVLNANINNYCVFNRHTVFGNNTHFNGCKIYGKGVVKFGDNFHSAQNLKILTSFHNYKGDKLPYDDTLIVKNVIIGDNVWIGLDVIILGGVTIGEGVIIQAGSVVSKSIPALSIAGGNPAVAFNKRDIDRYEFLKSRKKFF
ncbi:maltose O-acetyltransferase [Cyclobacterium xiamenense]|uniref:Maltose O-acetyltransferase n=1 Tax=Cyclobacterium xiamenense TaxID=1297121 RepID=A0A1H6YHA5_9BACT|nr:acyltransferase [Cyclobacterium xiamenense]SEJ40641.1 maltose O-acetyltransferase [Cyclobacterium xiamenense]